MTKDHIKFRGHKLDFHVGGKGEKVLLAFHGFGQSGEYYTSFMESLQDEYTVYAFDLFFHGESKYNDTDNALEKEELKDILSAFIKKQQLGSFSVAGYSMGGKFALACVEFFPEQLEQLILIAPDGIKTSFWYSLATYPHSFRNLFFTIIKKPEIFYKITKLAKSLGIVDKSILKFARSQMKTQEQRERVYFTWVIFRHLKYNMTTISQIINDHKISTLMITGEYDRIITSQNMHLLLNKLEEFEEIVLPTGHNHLIAESAEYLQGNKRFLV